MHHGHRIALLGAAAATFVAPGARAQQATPTPTPTPTPAPARTPTIITPGLERFSLPSSGAQSQPRPTPTPIAAPTPAPTAAATPGPAVQPVRATATPRPAERSVAQPPRSATPTPAPAPAPTPQPSSTATPAALPIPTPAAVPTPLAAPAEQPAGGLPWLWILLGGAGLLAVGAIGWLLGRRTRAVPEPVVEAPAAPRPAPPPPAPLPPPPRPVLAAVPVAPPEPIVIDFHPLGIEVGDKGAILEFEMGLRNASGVSADGLRVSLLLASANPEQDALIANFHAASGLPEAGPPVDLPAGEGGRIPGKLAIEAERIHVVQVGGRAMFVPIMLIDLRWRGGLSIRRHGADFMVGTAGQGGKLGPIWLDRGAQRIGGLAATRYLPQARPVAA